MQGWYYVESLTGQRHDRVHTKSQIATMDSCFDLVGSLQHGVASSCPRLQFDFQYGPYRVVAPLSFQSSISLASLFTSLSIFGWSDILQILRRQAAFSFAVLCIIMFNWENKAWRYIIQAWTRDSMGWCLQQLTVKKIKKNVNINNYLHKE